MRIRFAWRTMRSGRCKGFVLFGRKILASEQRKMGLKALAFKAFCVVQYAL